MSSALHMMVIKEVAIVVDRNHTEGPVWVVKFLKVKLERAV